MDTEMTLFDLKELIDQAIKGMGEETKIIIYNGVGDRLSYPVYIGNSLYDDRVEFE